MPAPLRFHYPTSLPKRAPESDAERRARHLDMLREMAQLAMTVARAAGAKETHSAPETPTPA